MGSDNINNVLIYAEDKSFIQWVRSDFSTDNEKWEALKNGDETKAAIHAAIDLVTALSFDNEKMSQQRKSKLFDRIESSIDAPKVKTLPKRNTRRLLSLIATAAVALLLVTVFWPRNSITNITTQFAEIQKFNLPDASEIILNAGSELSYDKKNYKNERSLELDGEAFFNVEKGQKFTVNTPSGSVEVLGTSFNVYSRNETFKVVCETGKVLVSNKDFSSSVTLFPGESCALINNKMVKGKRTFKSDDWIDGIYHYDGVKLSDVIEELERQFDIKIITDQVDTDVLYSGFFNRKKLQEALESVFWTLKIKFEIEDDSKVVIHN
ncbi:MAG: histidine kinase [Saprospiraceae bacterium]|nr:histidine kinase [Saprospiraceae bacterium]